MILIKSNILIAIKKAIMLVHALNLPKTSINLSYLYADDS